MTESKNRIKEILERADPKELRTLFAFNGKNTEVTVLFKFKAWTRHFFPEYFYKSPSDPTPQGDAEFHKEMDLQNLRAYRGIIDTYLNIAFRGGAKTVRAKLFIAFCIANDMEASRKFFKILSADDTNCVQSVTDIYNMLASSKVARVYPHIFRKTGLKREETMSSFVTADGIKVLADTVGSSQRGAVQAEARPDFIWFDDFETRETIRSAVKTKAIWDNMEEARTGLAKGGACIYTCNYFTEAGNVHKLVLKDDKTKHIVQIVPIIVDGVPTWDRYSVADIEEMKKHDEDFEGERMCKPSTQRNVYFDREMLDKQVAIEPKLIIGGFKIFREFNPSKPYGSGHDVSGGVGLDSSTSVFLEFATRPVQVCATFRSNTIKPDDFGDEINREALMFGTPLVAIERNNHGHATIARAKQLGVNQYIMERSATRINDEQTDEYGWNASFTSVAKAMADLAHAIKHGEIDLNDPELIQEAKSYTRDDSMDKPTDPRLMTRHFDLLRALAIAWQMRDKVYVQPDVEEQEWSIYNQSYR